MDLTNLKFGLPAAEREIAKGLTEYFVESESYERIKNREKTIILGNRGTGKSAIFKVLSDREKANRNIVLELSPEEYSYEILSTSLKAESEGAWNKHSAFAAAWKYLIYMLIMKAVTREGKKYKRGPSANIYNFLRDHQVGFQDNPIAVLISYLKRIEGIKIGSYEASMRTRELTSLYKLEEIKPLLEDLKDVCKHKKVLVMIDELDQGWDSSEDAKAFVSGLFQAALSINQLTENITVYISLRQELYDSIPAIYDDAQKYRDVIEIISWDEETLKKLISNRIRYFVPDLHLASDEDAWNAIFSEQIQYRKSKSFNYLIDRALYRPRELIQFCSDVLAQNSGKKYPMDYEQINVAESRYSEDRTKDIASEYRFQMPALNSVFEIFRGRQYSMSREDLEYICLSIVEGEARVAQDASAWVKGQDHEFLIEALWLVGFLKAYAVGGVKARRRSGSSYIGSYQVSNLNLGNITRFQVHPMFRTYLGMKESK